jgi:hypothetical protein
LIHLKKPVRIIFIDEDVPGGAAAYMFNKVLEEQGGYRYLDAAPIDPYCKSTSPGLWQRWDYFSKPNAEEIFEAVTRLIKE